VPHTVTANKQANSILISVYIPSQKEKKSKVSLSRTKSLTCVNQ